MDEGNSFLISFKLRFNLLSRRGLPMLCKHQAQQPMASTSRLRVPPWQAVEMYKEPGMKSTGDLASKPGQTERPLPLSLDEMPEWFRREFNQWIDHGCRPVSGSFHSSFFSWSHMHNESADVYAHLILAIFFLLGEWDIQRYQASRYCTLGSPVMMLSPSPFSG